MQSFHISTLAVAAGLLASSALACTGSGTTPEETTISREEFIQAYVQLRRESLRSPEMEIDVATKDRLLEELGVTEDDLLRFVEVWGTDFELMQSVWQEVDSLQREDRRRGEEDFPYEEDEPEESVLGIRGRGGS